MIKRVTTFLLLMVGLSIAGTAIAQPTQVTIRELNAISEENVAALNAGGATLTEGDIQPLVLNDLQGVEVQFVAVVLSDPLSSGLGTPQENDGGNPDRIHVYVRDTSAVSQGPEGMGIQLVDGSYAATGLINVTVGNVIRVTGSASMFTGSGGNSQQVGPTTIEVLGDYNDVNFELPESILDPVVITSADANAKIDEEGGVQVNWNNLASLNGQYVRLEGASIVTRDISSERPNWLISSDGGETVLNFYDVSLRYRNDRDGAYPNTFNVRSNDFVPPPPGASVNIQGFLVYQGDDPFGRGVPDGAILSIAPFQDSDLEITASPPEASVPVISAVPAADEAATVTTTAEADPARTLTGVSLTYFTSANATEQTLPMNDNGDGSYSADVPGQPEGTFVNYKATATDNTGASFTSNAGEYRVLSDGIDEIADIQETSGFNGDVSPFANLTLAMNLTATVQNNPAVNGREIAIQDKADLAPNSGVTVNPNTNLIADLQPGDVINITSALIVEDFGVTQLRDLVYTTVTEGGDILDYKEVTTDVLQDPEIAEAHEGMLLIFNNAVVTSTNPDDPAGPFGEWAVSSDGTADNQVRVDDRSNGIDFGAEQNAGTVFSVWERLEFIRGVWWFSFDNYKLMPDDLANDVGAVLNVANEDDNLPRQFALSQNFPNPFNPTTSIHYQVAHIGPVTLKVFDILGREVATLVDEVVGVGEHTVSFDAKDLPSGMYLYRLTAGADVATRKMMLLK